MISFIFVICFLSICGQKKLWRLGALVGYYLQTTERFWDLIRARPQKKFLHPASS